MRCADLPLSEAQTAWTSQDVKQMKHVLKEQGEPPGFDSYKTSTSHLFGRACLGMAAFLNEYVVRRTIPIPKLLYAFGVCLVSVSCSCCSYPPFPGLIGSV